MNTSGTKFVKKYLDMAFNYLYICPLFLRMLFFYPDSFGKKTQIFLKLVSNNTIYSICPMRIRNPFFYALSINFGRLTFNNQEYA
jgi:hypothetical protein